MAPDAILGRPDTKASHRMKIPAAAFRMTRTRAWRFDAMPDVDVQVVDRLGRPLDALTLKAPASPAEPTAPDPGPPTLPPGQPDPRAEARRYRTVLGERGAVLFVDGKTFDQAIAIVVGELNDRVADLGRQLAAAEAQAGRWGSGPATPAATPTAAATKVGGPVTAAVAGLANSFGPPARTAHPLAHREGGAR